MNSLTAMSYLRWPQGLTDIQTDGKPDQYVANAYNIKCNISQPSVLTWWFFLIFFHICIPSIDPFYYRFCAKYLRKVNLSLSLGKAKEIMFWQRKISESKWAFFLHFFVGNYHKQYVQGEKFNKRRVGCM